MLWQPFSAKTCPSGLVHFDCGPACPPTCQKKNQTLECVDQCINGCFCPHGTILDGEACVEPEQCSCIYRGESFAVGTKRRDVCEEW